MKNEDKHSWRVKELQEDRYTTESVCVNCGCTRTVSKTRYGGTSYQRGAINFNHRPSCVNMSRRLDYNCYD